MDNATTTTETVVYCPPSPYSLGCLTRLQLLDWALVVRCLHWKGSLYDHVGHVVRDGAWLRADGFGPRTLDELDEIAWDWSHVRDSSREATQEIAAYLRRNGFDLPAKDYARALA